MVPFWEFINSFCLNATRPSRVSRTGLTFKTLVFSLVNNTPGNYCSIVKKNTFKLIANELAEDKALASPFRFTRKRNLSNTRSFENASLGSVPVCYVLQSVSGRPYFGIRKHRMNRASHSHWACKAARERITSVGFRVATRVPRYLSYDSRISITDPSKI